MNKTRKTVGRSEDVLLLAKFVGEGDEVAFAQIVHKYESLVWNICCRILHNRCDAEDAYQSTFLLLATKARRIRKPKSLSSWLYGVAFRTASSVRKQRQRGMLPYENSADAQLSVDVLEQVARKNEIELVSAEIMLMKEKYKTPLLMHYFLGNSISQIADTLGLTVSAVEGRLRQAKRTLKFQLRIRGIGVDESCALLVLPVLAMQPSLTCTTISNALAASIAKGTLCLLTSSSFGLDKIGARFMLMKIAVSFGLVCVTSIGMLHQGNFPYDGEQVTQIKNGQSQVPVATVPIKFVQDDDEGAEPSMHEHLDEFHSHLYGIYRQVRGTWFGQAESRPRHEFKYRVIPKDLSTQIELAIVEESTLEMKDAEPTGGIYRVLLNNYDEALAEQELQVEMVDDELLAKIKVRTAIPILSDVPLVGRFFQNTLHSKADGIILNVKPVIEEVGEHEITDVEILDDESDD